MKNVTVTTAILIDATRRDLNCHMVSITEAVPDVRVRQVRDRLVLRNGMDLGPLISLGNGLKEVGLPVLILGETGYQAVSSCGFVRMNRPGIPYAEYVDVVGLQGFPWMAKKGLRHVKSVPAILIPNAIGITKIPIAQHLNAAVKSAVLTGSSLLQKIRRSSLFIEQGQSNCAGVWEVPSPEPEEYKEVLFISEHQPDWTWCPDLKGSEGRTLKGGLYGRDEGDFLCPVTGELSGFPQKCLGHSIKLVAKGSAEPGAETIPLNDEWEIVILPSDD